MRMFSPIKYRPTLTGVTPESLRRRADEVLLALAGTFVLAGIASLFAAAAETMRHDGVTLTAITALTCGYAFIAASFGVAKNLTFRSFVMGSMGRHYIALYRRMNTLRETASVRDASAHSGATHSDGA